MTESIANAHDAHKANRGQCEYSHEPCAHGDKLLDRLCVDVEKYI